MNKYTLRTLIFLVVVEIITCHFCKPTANLFDNLLLGSILAMALIISICAWGFLIIGNGCIFVPKEGEKIG
jgi:hypothetical protein